MVTMEELLIELDDRRRAHLGRVGNPEHRRYLVRTQPDGTMIFTPAVVMSELEARFLRNEELQRRIAAVEADPAALVARPRRRG